MSKNNIWGFGVLSCITFTSLNSSPVLKKGFENVHCHTSLCNTALFRCPVSTGVQILGNVNILVID